IVYKEKVQVAVGTTDVNGDVMIRSIAKGKYNIKAAYVGYNPQQINDVKVDSNKTTYVNIPLSNEGIKLQSVEVVDYSIPTIDPNTISGGTVTKENYQHMAAKDVNGVISTQAGVISNSNGYKSKVSVRGCRAGGKNVFIDGERAIGTNNLPQSAVEQVPLTLGGLPAQYEYAPLPDRNQTSSFIDQSKKVVAVKTVIPPAVTNNEGTEEYSIFKENAFAGVRNQPLSTFAIDVDAASYSNTRRMLSQGLLPQKDAVRIEEFINYFKYNYPQPKENKPFSISTEYAVCPWNKEHKLLQIGLKGKELDANISVPNNLVFLIDVSGSMSDEDKLPLLIRGFKLLAKQLREQDKLSIVVYAGSSGVVLDAVSGDETNRINTALESLHAGGSTAGGEGINLAYKMAEKYFIKNGNNRVILATDGDFNVGVSSEDELKTLIEEKRSHGIYLSVLGFGEGNIKDNKMETLADKGNGNYYYIDNFMEARKVLVSQFGGTMYTIAKDVKIQVEFNPAKVKEYRLIGYDNRMLNAEDFNNDKKDAGELGAGHCVTALYEIIPVGSPDSQVSVDELKYTKVNPTDNSNEIATVKFRYKGVKKQDTTSKLIEEVVLNNVLELNQTSTNFKLAAGVSEFGLLLRGSEYKGLCNFKEAIELVTPAKQNDPDGYIAGLIEMMKSAKELMSVELTKK
ncbi:MAG: von Willebrand factor type A domain-containing protein, partial [Bacteroidia bacterium]